MREVVTHVLLGSCTDATVYCEIAAPFAAEATQETLAPDTSPVAATEVGADGAAAGVTSAVAAEAADVPLAFVAVTVNEYFVPLLSPDTTQELTETRETGTVYEHDFVAS
jgi:hypothetical protein